MWHKLSEGQCSRRGVPDPKPRESHLHPETTDLDFNSLFAATLSTLSEENEWKVGERTGTTRSHCVGEKRGTKSAQEAAQLVEMFKAARRVSKSYWFEPSTKPLTVHSKPSGFRAGQKELEPSKLRGKICENSHTKPLCFCFECPVKKARAVYFCSRPMLCKK